MIDNVLSVRNLSISFQENLTTNTVLFNKEEGIDELRDHTFKLDFVFLKKQLSKK